MKRYTWSVVLLLLTGGIASANPFDVAGNFKKIDQSETALLKELDALTIEKGVPEIVPEKHNVLPKKKEKAAVAPAGMAKEKHPSAATPEVQEAVKIETAEERIKRVHAANTKEKALAAKQHNSEKQAAEKRADVVVKRTPHKKVDESKKILSAASGKKPHKKMKPSVKREKEKTLARHERGKIKRPVVPPKKEIAAEGMEQKLAEAIRAVDQE